MQPATCYMQSTACDLSVFIVYSSVSSGVRWLVVAVAGGHGHVYTRSRPPSATSSALWSLNLNTPERQSRLGSPSRAPWPMAERQTSKASVLLLTHDGRWQLARRSAIRRGPLTAGRKGKCVKQCYWLKGRREKEKKESSVSK
jgi:hypothetical protein